MGIEEYMEGMFNTVEIFLGSGWEMGGRWERYSWDY